jgi:hypothetical protein
MKIISFTSFLILLLQQGTDVISLQFQGEFSGWVFVLENDEKVSKSNDIYFTIAKEGVVYINDNRPTQRIQLKLYDNNRNDISKNVKLFRKSTYVSSSQNNKEHHFYAFYYPTKKELELDPEVWRDIDFYHEYTEKLIVIKQKLKEQGYFD